jgi:hypothetical protein
VFNRIDAIGQQPRFVMDEDIAERWLEITPYTERPLSAKLSGLSLEYRLIQLHARDAGKREATIRFSLGLETLDLGYRSQHSVLFDCAPAREITLRLLDEHGKPTTASLLIEDHAKHVFPPRSKRLAPDFFFQSHIYRDDGAKLALTDGDYQITFQRGPASVPETRRVTVTSEIRELTFQVKRWIDPSARGWWSGDHHLHAAGCDHYTDPTAGVPPSAMALHCRGEDLKVGSVLTWGPGFDYQKQFFCGAEDKASTFPHLIRYDIEVAGFGSQRSGHLLLLRLKDQIYPGGTSYLHWPTLGLTTIKWAKAQGAITGPPHTGLGISYPGEELPSYSVPPYDDSGANEYIVDVTHEVPGPDGKLVPAIDIFAVGDTPHKWELNMWYHTLNAGFRSRAAGETDFPCITDEKVGAFRSYVKLDSALTYDAWCEGLRQGRSYVSNGKAHLMDFQADGFQVGQGDGVLALAKPATVCLSVKAAALLDALPKPEIKARPFFRHPYWDLERARVGETRRVAVEVIVNGYPVAQQEIVADGGLEDLSFDLPVERSSWVALRILPAAHTNPIFIEVGGKPIRASRRSLDWCLQGVDQCWASKERYIASDEKETARQAYEHARQVYRARLAECDRD